MSTDILCSLTQTSKHITEAVTHGADFQFVSLHGLQPHERADRAAHQDLIGHVEPEDVAKLLGITWGGKKNMYVCETASVLVSRIACAGMTLRGNTVIS